MKKNVAIMFANDKQALSLDSYYPKNPYKGAIVRDVIFHSSTLVRKHLDQKRIMLSNDSIHLLIDVESKKQNNRPL